MASCIRWGKEDSNSWRREQLQSGHIFLPIPSLLAYHSGSPGLFVADPAACTDRCLGCL